MSTVPNLEAPEPAISQVQSKAGLCGICPAGCWVKLTLDGGSLLKVEPDSDHPLGTICRIGHRSPQLVHDPDRLQTPLRRVGPRGTHTFEPISWDQAFEIIVENLQALKTNHGPESTAIYTGRGSFDMALCDLYQPADTVVSSASSVLFPFGSPNTLGVGALCYVSFAMIAPHTTLGEMAVSMDTDIEQAELIVIWGANPATDSPPLLHQQILNARRRGAEVISIDPQRNGTAREVGADWIPIRPGTDGALALGMIQVLIEEDLLDEDFVDHWTEGFEGLQQLTQHYRADVVEGITGVPADTVRQLARRISSANGASPVMYTGLEYSDSGVQAIRAMLTFWALAGQLDVPGGLLIRMRENAFPQNRTRLVSNPNLQKALGRDRFPVYSMYRGESHAIALPDAVLKGEPYKIRGLIVLGGSLITAWPDPDLWKRTLNALDFLVSINRYHTADSAFADIVLPASTMYEATSYMRYGPLFKIREKMLEPIGQSRCDALILGELAKRLGYGHLFPQSEEEILEWALEGSGFTVAQVREAGGSVQIPTKMMQYKKWQKGSLRLDGQPGFNTPSGKFEIDSSTLREHGYQGLPEYTEPAEGPLSRPDLAQRFPLVFNSGTRTYHDFRSQHHGVKDLAKRQPDPVVTLNAEDARERGIKNGDWVWIESPRGRVKQRARVTQDIVRGAIDANQGGGGPLGAKSWRECNINALTDPERYDPISGFPIYKTLLCQVSKAADGGDTVLGGPEGEAIAQTDTKKYVQKYQQVYFDHNATTFVHDEVLEAMMPFLTHQGGNPSSIHGDGVQARNAVEAARRKVAQLLHCTARRVIFTGGGSEANNLALKGVVAAAGPGPHHIIVSAIEHPAILKTCHFLEQGGHQITVLPVDGKGGVSTDVLREALRPDTLLVSIMMANNEVGTLQAIGTLAAAAHRGGALFHTDAVQAVGKVPVDVQALGVDLLSMSAHKLEGPKGVGALFIRKGVTVIPLIHGGGQEWALRAGTENVPGIVGMGKACDVALRAMNQGAMEDVAALRDALQQGILDRVAGAVVNGDCAHRLPNTLHLTLPGIRGESLVLNMSRRGLRFSSGSACKSGNPDPSHVLLAMGLDAEAAHCSIRLSLGVQNTDEEVQYCLEVLDEVLRDTLSAVRFTACR